MKIILTALFVLLSTPAFAQSKLEKVEHAALFANLSIQMIPVGITTQCLTAQTCRELNPFMAKVFGKRAENADTATALKAGLGFISSYAMWQMPSETKKQRVIKGIVIGAALTLNTYDTIHDIRQFRKIQRRR